MKLCIKKVYCPKCRRAVTPLEPPASGPCRVLCSKCKTIIYVSNGIYWRRGHENEPTPPAKVEPAPAEKPKLQAKAPKRPLRQAAPAAQERATRPAT